MWQQNQAYYHAHSTINQTITSNVAIAAIKIQKNDIALIREQQGKHEGHDDADNHL